MQSKDLLTHYFQKNCLLRIKRGIKCFVLAELKSRFLRMSLIMDRGLNGRHVIPYDLEFTKHLFLLFPN